MPRRRRVGALSVAVALLAGCATGSRPYFDDDDTTLSSAPTGDANVDAVLTRLATLPSATFTAHLDVLTRYGQRTTAVVVSQEGEARRSVTIGSVRYVVDGESRRTCDLDAGTCTDGIDESRVSDVQLTSDFFGRAAQRRLRRDAGAKISTTTASTETFADQEATCVHVPVSGGETSYCALGSGVLAALDGADLTVTLRSYSPTVDESLFAPS